MCVVMSFACSYYGLWSTKFNEGTAHSGKSAMLDFMAAHKKGNQSSLESCWKFLFAGFSVSCF